MKLEEQLISDLLRFPSLFKSRVDLYDFYFCTIGNGMKWENGEIVSNDPDEQVQLKTIEDGINHVFDISDNEIANSTPRFMLSLLQDNILSIIKFGEWLHIMKFSEDNRPYGVYETSLICQIPEDVKPDWKQACIEYVDFLRKNEHLLDEKSIKLLNQINIPMQRMKLEYNDTYYSIINDSDTETLLYLDDLQGVGIFNMESVLSNVVEMYNNNKPLTEIDNYLQNCSDCVEEDREEIMEALFRWDNIFTK